MTRVSDNDPPAPSSENIGNEMAGSSRELETRPQVHQSDHRDISFKQLINKLNHLNFQDENITVIFNHTKYPRSLKLPATPLPCHNQRLTCDWAEEVDTDQVMESYQFNCIYVPSGQQLLEVEPELKSISGKQVVFVLPEKCREVSVRKIHRYRCTDVKVYLFQNGALFTGELIDYGNFQFRIVVHKVPPQTYRWIDADTPVTIVFTQGKDTLYSGDCRIIRHDQGIDLRQIILEPVHRQVRRFGPKEFRSTRQQLSPSPDIIFSHPLFKKTVNLKVLDISGSGVSVEEEEHLAVLLPGMIIPNLELRFSDGSSVSGMAQVVYSVPHREGSDSPALRCGLAFLDMPVEDHIRLLALLQQASDAKAYLCNKVDMEALWDFFFETGFIYPQKYDFIKSNKDKIKQTYEKLYHKSPSIASHFIYQENGRIMAHMAMVRFYETSWLIHHHAAIRSSNNRGGLMVLNQVGRFINDSHRLYSMKMDCVFCYYRPDNKFPNHVFGGTARNINDVKRCSVDTFAYFHQVVTPDKAPELPSNWVLEPAADENLLDLKTYYDHRSGGLMLQALHLHPGQTDLRDLAALYGNIGLKRDRHIFALHRLDRLCAIVVVNVADLGLNMSDLTNSINIYVTNGTHLTHELIETVIASLAHYLELEEIPVLIYPREAATKAGIDFHKSYSLWVLATHRNTDYYFRFLKRLLKFIKY